MCVHRATSDAFVPTAPAAAVLLLGLVPILEWSAIDALAPRVGAWFRPGTLALITAFGNRRPRSCEVP